MIESSKCKFSSAATNVVFEGVLVKKLAQYHIFVFQGLGMNRPLFHKGRFEYILVPQCSFLIYQHHHILPFTTIVPYNSTQHCLYKIIAAP